ncbi:twin-arginine translocation pathway signal protein [Oceanomicrobium pacificus]|uniref:Twin-arginine translocation pathway signal protein n=1 Tax=Oceanomicrobium pacificus TaxID=2692916 RepID=A0A6B0TZL7_9RHOB|nr:twin-arginine translocation pathway signal protein [Oceanomicrobium pacificus]MXU66453.1 twin-arginine translocation pathway signal protein [Oceanomicrobium pacificus]
MDQTDKPDREDRRAFLRLTSTAAPAALLATAAGVDPAAAAEEQPTSGLRLTPHVKAYLDSARF